MYPRSNTPGLVITVEIRYHFDIRHEIVSNDIAESPREVLLPRRYVTGAGHSSSTRYVIQQQAP